MGSKELNNRRYYRAEVHLSEGSQNYDLVGYTKEQIINDILDQYERHMQFLHWCVDPQAAGLECSGLGAQHHEQHQRRHGDTEHVAAHHHFCRDGLAGKPRRPRH